jgi:hypothetical protein
MMASKIRRHINQLSGEALFNNKDFLKFASRATVDRTLSQLCKGGIIIREARGVYRRAVIPEAPAPSLMEIVLFKAKVFGRKIVQDFLDAAKECGISGVQGNDELTFITDGASSSFMTMSGVRVHLKNRCARKVGLDDGLIHRVIKALWHFGDPLKQEHLAEATMPFGRTERQELREQAGLMPGWMADALSEPERERERQLNSKEERFARREEARIQGVYAAQFRGLGDTS